ncbi:hypothetical protein L596_003065 [Steinernema carpocapsae]|uniref:BTB domain-containing protein n=1 Tax=Steinernema carpocapsae TaxID=34508 RepID=A0A4U8URJ2_STECR|nr:hypothetical protein L596_003065 [Steinernema carpocapsae]
MSPWNAQSMSMPLDGPTSSSYPSTSNILNTMIEPIQSTSKDECRTITNASIEVLLDFTRPDGQRTRPLLVDGKRLYVDEHYISVWSPILRAWCIECPDRELILANVQYDHILEMLHTIHPTYKEIDDQTVHILLPIAFDYQMEGLLHRCECFLVNHRMPLLEKIWLADRYKLDRLLVLCLREIRPNHRFDLTGSRYHALSDRVKVFLLERLHGNTAPEVRDPGTADRSGILPTLHGFKLCFDPCQVRADLLRESVLHRGMVQSIPGQFLPRFAYINICPRSA